MAAGIVGGMPASAEVINTDYTVDSPKKFEFITAVDPSKKITLNNSLTIEQPQNGTESTLNSAISGNGTLTLKDVKLTVKDNANTSFGGTINLQGNTVVNVIHLTGLTGTKGTGTICVGDGSKLVGNGRGYSNSDIQVNARLSGGGSIELIEETASKITLANAENDFSGTFSLKNGTLTWANANANADAVKFFSYEDTKTKLDDVTLDVTSDVTFKSLELTSSMIDLNEGATLQADSLTLTDSGYQNTIVGSGTINALLTSGAKTQILRIGNVNESCNVNLSAEGEHTYIGKIIISPGATLDVAGSLRDPLDDTSRDLTIEVRGILNVRGDYNRSQGTITIKSGGKATFAKDLAAWSLNVESGGTLNLMQTTNIKDVSGSGTISIGKILLMILSEKSETEALKIGNEFQGDGILSIFRKTPGDVVFEGNSASSRIGTLNLTNSRVASSNAGAVLEKAQNTSIMSSSVLTIDSVQSVQNLKLESGGKLSFEGGMLSFKSGSNNEIKSMDALSGSGTLSLDSQSALVISNAEKDTAFTGSFNLGQGTKLTLKSDSDFELPLTVSGDGNIGIDANGGTFSIKSADRIKGLSGTLSLSNTKFTIDEKVAGKNLSADNGTILTISDKEKLGGVSLTDATISFTDEGTPGTIGEAGSHLSVENLNISGRNRIVVDASQLVAANPPSGSGKAGLAAQDVIKESRSSDLTTVLISSVNDVSGDGSFRLVDKNNQEIAQGSKKFGIVDDSGDTVAEGTYGYGISTTKNNVGIAWQLTEVSIFNEKVLALSQRKGEDNVLSAKLTGAGGFTAESGRITLAAENDYTGPTTVKTNAEIVASNDKSLGKTSRLDNHGTVMMTDRKIEVVGPTENSGTINIGMGTYTTGSYKGSENSVLRIAAEVTADKASSGMLVVNGLAEGTSRVDLQLTDATIGRAVTGIDVAKLGKGSTLTLSLANPVSKGDYNYLLMSTDDGTSYYIVGTLKDAGGGDQQGGDGGEEEGGDDDKKPMTTSQLKTPEAGARAALAFLNQRAFDFGLNAHIGEKSYADLLTGERKTTSLWLIQGGSWSRMDDSSGQLRNDGHMTTTNLGGDLYAWNAAGGRFSVGLMGGWVDGSYDVDSNITGLKADADFDGWSLGAYAAWQHEGESGLFANAQVRWNDFTNEVKGQGLKKEKYHANGMSLGVEAGWNQRLWTAAASDESRAMAWDTAPFARVTWSGVSADDHTDVYGQRFSVEGDGNVAITLGARTSFEFGSKDQTPRFADPIVRVYAEGAWVHNTKTFESTVVNDKGASTAEFAIDDYGQFRVGLEGEFTKNFRLWGDVTHEAGSSGYSSTGFTVGAKYVF